MGQGKRDTAGEKLNVGEAGFWRIKGNKGSATKKAVMLNSFSASASVFLQIPGQARNDVLLQKRCHAELVFSICAQFFLQIPGQARNDVLLQKRCHAELVFSICIKNFYRFRGKP